MSIFVFLVRERVFQQVLAKNIKKFKDEKSVKVCLHSSYVVWKSLQFDEFFDKLFLGLIPKLAENVKNSKDEKNP